MKSTKKTAYTILKSSPLFLLTILVLASCQTADENTVTPTATCDTVTKIEGKYSCTGECVVTNADGTRTLVTVTGETDDVQRFPGTSKSIYQVSIVGSNDFSELEIGPLTGLTLRTATAEVSDKQHPVLEEYVFDTDSYCRAIGFTKTVRNPNAALFKTCIIYGVKDSK